ncbi:MAG: acyl-CoA dehydrogenase [Acidimicrobiia bacterium]|nr:acyl-CoA dehydrogenase [Acidimicrobiia bacterium]
MSTTEELGLVDSEKLKSFLATVAPIGDTFEVEVLSGGMSNLTYLVRTGQHEYVARRRPLGAVAAGAHDMNREYRVLAGLRETDLPFPRAFGYTDDESIIGAPFYVMSRVHGSVFHRPEDVKDLSPAQTAAISKTVVEVLKQLHAIDYKAVGLGELGKPEGFVGRRISRWLDQWNRSEHRDHPLLESLSPRLQAALPEQADSTLIHGDYRLGNMLIATDDPVRVTAVLDWEMSTLGDPLTDLAHLLVYWDPTRGRVTHEAQLIAQQPGFETSARLAAHYGEITGRSLEHLDFYLAFEHWRAAIIKEGIYMRRVKSGRVDESTEEFGASIERHLEETAELLG